ncbi:MAG: iron-sulfur cluster assembly accessory protein [Prochloraceae cyanobacterium]|nr:iron-sulfur cluster assembly accessory protein [Prochloraceae cyanobacterium]
MIQISPAASREIKRLKSNQPNQNSRFRLKVKPGGCLGAIYSLEIEAESTKEETGDLILEINDIVAIVDSESYPYLQNLKLDYAEDLMGGGFRFNNPDVSSTCSCGQSFKLKS